MGNCAMCRVDTPIGFGSAQRGDIMVLPRTTTQNPELNSVVGAFTLQHQSSGMPFLSISAQRPSVEDSKSCVENSYPNQAYTTSSETENILVLRVYSYCILT